MTNPDYSKMTSEEEFDLLCKVADKHSVSELMMLIPNIHSDIREFFNNEVLDMWTEDNPLKAFGDLEDYDKWMGEQDD